MNTSHDTYLLVPGWLVLICIVVANTSTQVMFLVSLFVPHIIGGTVYVVVIGRLVPVSSTPRGASTPGLSTP